MRRLKPIVDLFRKTNVVAALFAGPLVLVHGGMTFAQSNGNLSYNVKCAVCHGTTGLGDTSPGKQLNIKPFTDSTVLAMSDATLQNIIVSGSGKMPAYKGKLPDAEVTNLIQYIHTLQNHQ
jgi:cytochrome c6